MEKTLEEKRLKIILLLLKNLIYSWEKRASKEIELSQKLKTAGNNLDSLLKTKAAIILNQCANELEMSISEISPTLK